MTNDNPCHGCTKRHAECHVTCPDGIEWSKRDQARRAAIKEERRKNNELYAYKRDRIHDTIKRATSGGKKRHK